MKLGADSSGEEVCRDRGVWGARAFQISFPSSRFPMTSFHPSLRPLTASPLTYPLPHPLFATTTHMHMRVQTHTHTHTHLRLSQEDALARFWHPDNKTSVSLTGWRRDIQSPLSHRHTSILRRNYPVLKSFKPQY